MLDARPHGQGHTTKEIGVTTPGYSHVGAFKRGGGNCRLVHLQLRYCEWPGIQSAQPMRVPLLLHLPGGLLGAGRESADRAAKLHRAADELPRAYLLEELGIPGVP